MADSSKMVVTDLDGTLLNTHRSISKRDWETLLALGERGITRVISTGRSWHVAKKVLEDHVPIDFLVTSTGLGIVDWKKKELIHSSFIPKEEMQQVTDFLLSEAKDFMIHHTVPHNHAFSFSGNSGRSNPDFLNRCRIYSEFAEQYLPGSRAQDASQFIVVEPVQEETVYNFLVGSLPNFNVVRTTSPLDASAMWIEIFPKGVSKASSAQWLRDHVGARRVLAVGNDYNDEQLLDWADRSFVVENAPETIRKKHTVVASCDQSGFSEAVEYFLESEKQSVD